MDPQTPKTSIKSLRDYQRYDTLQMTSLLQFVENRLGVPYPFPKETIGNFGTNPCCIIYECSLLQFSLLFDIH
jgi:hypothetical protein